MPDEPFMLVSLKEDKAKKLANVIANPTCTRILDHLAQSKESTESAIAKELKIPLSTVHYNLQLLVEAKLVIVEEFHYSAKGREVNHYKLANKYIIIAPKEDDPRFLERLKKLIPATILTLGFAAALKTMQLLTPGASIAGNDAALMTTPAPFAQEAVDTGAMKTADAVVEESARSMATIAMDANATNASAPVFIGPPVAPSVPWWQSPMIDWFLVGAAFVLVVLIIGELIAHWRSKRKAD